MTVQNARPSPFNQLSTDADWESIVGGFGAGDGVISPISGSLAPSLDGTGRNAVMAAGSCLVKGKLWSCDASVNTAIPAASGQDRIDRLTLRLLRTAGNATAFLQPNIITGTPSGSPVIPNLTQTTTGIWDLPISHWRSTSAGGLTGLVDERFDSGTSMQSGLAANMPMWHVRPRLYFQTDTRVVYLWDGTQWNPLYYVPTFFTSMPAMTNGWSINDFAKYRLTNDGQLQLAFKHLNVGTSVDSTTIWAAGSIPAALRPQDFHRVNAVIDLIRMNGANPETPCLEVCPDGSISCFGMAAASARCDCYAIVPINI
jgi:hypothetical protein